MSDLRFPIGPFTFDPRPTPDLRRQCIAQIAEAPGALRAAVAGLDDRRIETPYRPGGWTVRQVVHHVPDSHMNAAIRFVALTEGNRQSRPQKPRARVADTADATDVSLTLLKALHRRWGLLESMADADFERPLQHRARPITLDQLLQVTRGTASTTPRTSRAADARG